MSSEHLEAAAAIGRRLAGDAVWHDGRCSWVGVVPDPAEAWRTEYRALEPNLYDGSAGVGLFLARLAAATGDPEARRTAVGALRHAVDRAPAGRREGFHAGSLGIAWAAAVTADLLGEDELRAAEPVPPVQGRFDDVVLGTAGSVIARLALGDLDGAVAGGERLVARAAVTPHGWSWAAPGQGRRHPLCGLAHGAGGIGWALLELFAATGDERFRAGSEGAFAYERSWLHEPSGTWPDLRVGGQRRGARPGPATTVGSWCHGEGGIVLTRLRAIELLGPEPYEHEAALALETTRRVLAEALPYEIEDLTLCHGAAGAADVVLCGGGSRAAADELGQLVLDRYADGGWPCGARGGGTSPTLFRGLAGIGWWLLRMHDPAIPSPLAMPMRLTRVVARA